MRRGYLKIRVAVVVAISPITNRIVFKKYNSTYSQ